MKQPRQVAGLLLALGLGMVLGPGGRERA